MRRRGRCPSHACSMGHFWTHLAPHGLCNVLQDAPLFTSFISSSKIMPPSCSAQRSCPALAPIFIVPRRLNHLIIVDNALFLLSSTISSSFGPLPFTPRLPQRTKCSWSIRMRPFFAMFVTSRLNQMTKCTWSIRRKPFFAPFVCLWPLFAMFVASRLNQMTKCKWSLRRRPLAAFPSPLSVVSCHKCRISSSPSFCRTTFRGHAIPSSSSPVTRVGSRRRRHLNKSTVAGSQPLPSLQLSRISGINMSSVTGSQPLHCHHLSQHS